MAKINKIKIVLLIFLLSTYICIYGQTEQDKEWTRWSYLSAPHPNKHDKKSSKGSQNDNNNNSTGYKTGNSDNQLLQSPVNLPDIVIDDFGGNPDFYHSENSVFISPGPVNPDFILNSNNHHELIIFPCFSSILGINPQGVSAQISVDVGQTWNGLIGNLNNSFGDPTVAIGRNGRMYIGYVNIVPPPDPDSCTIDAIQVSWSDDGITWNEVLVHKNPGRLQDKPHLWIDNGQFNQDGTINPNEGNLYIAWTNTDPIPSWSVLISRSTDDGLTWSSAIEISSGVAALKFNLGVNIQTGPNGEVYVCWAVYDNAPAFGGDAIAIGFAKNLNGGDPSDWDLAQRIIFNIEGIDSWQGSPPSELGGGKDMRVNSFPVMTVNQQNGEIYIVWTNRGEPFNNTGDPDIYIIKSTDQGNTWDSDSLDPVRVNQDPIGNGKDQWFPWIACDETSGALVVIYYDSRTDNTKAKTFVSISYDGGDTWEDHLISDANWSGQAFTGEYAGDYIGIDVSHGRAVPVWSDDRTGNMLAYTQPFDVPCPADLILCNAIITNEAAYNVTNNITVGGLGCVYIIRNTANVKMEAGNEIVISGEFVSEGEFIAQIEPTCTVFGQKMGNINSPNGENNTNDDSNIIDEPITKESASVENGTVHIYPNPNNGQFTLLIPPTEEKTMVYIEDVLGRMIYNSEITNPQSEIDISSHPKGIYFVIVIQGNSITRKKIVLQ